MHVVGHHLSDEIILLGIPQSDDLCILEAMIDESGGPPTACTLLAIADIGIRRLSVAEVLTIEGAVGIQFLSIDDADGVALLAAYPYFQPAGNVLTNIHNSPFCRRRYCQVPPPFGRG